MAANRYRLVIGNKNWSSWSLRPWLAMRRLGLPFEEINVRLRLPESKAEIAKYSPSGLVPLLLDGDLAIWDSLAILEYLADAAPRQGHLARGPAGARAGALRLGRDALRLRAAAPHLLDGDPGTQPARPRAGGSRGRHPPHRRPLAGVPGELRRRRAVPVRRVLGGRCDVCARRLALSHLRARPRPLTATTARRPPTSTPIFAMPEMAEWIAGARAEVAAAA